jgi:hypothetical protein
MTHEPNSVPPRQEAAKAPLGLIVRLAIYLFAGHLFAGFLYLLFMLGGKG